MSAQSELPLEGVKVLDLSRLLPGPYATLVLADLGAQVDKVEEPQGGDYLRQMWPHFGEESAFFYALNRNKRSVTLDLKTPEGVAALRKLVRSYDVLVESFRPGVMERLGLGWQTLSQDNPRLIYCAISGYGQTGPDRLKAGHDLNYVARAGVLASTGAEGGSPVVSGAQVADVGGGSLFAVSGILAALLARERTGKGRFVDISMAEGALAFLHMHLGARLLTGNQPAIGRGQNPLNGAYACYGVYRTQDGRHLAVGSLEPKFFQGVCEVLGRPELVQDAYVPGPKSAKVKEELAAIFATAPLSSWLERFRGKDLCVEPVLEESEIFGDAQHVARQVVVQATDGRHGASPVKHLRTPLSPVENTVRLPPPALGEHTQEVLRDAGLSDAEIAALRRV